MSRGGTYTCGRPWATAFSIDFVMYCCGGNDNYEGKGGITGCHQ